MTNSNLNLDSKEPIEGFTKSVNNENVLYKKLNNLRPDIMRENFHLYDFKKLFIKYFNKNITSFLFVVARIILCKRASGFCVE